MSDSWRIDVKLNDQSAVTRPIIGSTGATVIKASKGPETPVYFAPGQSKRIRNIFGAESATYFQVWDAIQYNNSFPIWISAPSSNGRYGGVIVRPTGTEAFAGGVPSTTTLSFSAFSQVEQAGTGDNSTTNFLYTIGNYTDYVALSIDVLLDGISENVVAVDSGATETLTGDNGSGTYTKATGIVDYTFSTAPSTDAVVEVNYNINISDAYFVLYSTAPNDNELATLVTHDGTNFIVSGFKKNSDATYTALSGYPKTVNITSGSKDGFGANIYVDDVFENDDFFGGHANPSVTFTSFVDDSTNVDFDGGLRGTTVGTDLVRGWDFFEKKRTYPVDLFFDVSADPLIPPRFVTLRTSFQKYSHYVLPLPNNEDSTTAIATKQGYSVSNRGISFYWNWGRVQNTQTGGSFYSPLIGKVAFKHSQMYDIFNGLQPSWIDENNHGGQLGSGILEMVYDPSEAELETLDQASVNPIIFDPQYGVLIASAKTSLTTLSDYSYIGHSRSADYLITNIQQQALPAQLTKLNDQNHRTQVRLKADSIVRPVFAAGLLREYAIVCDETNNTDDVLQRREFVIDVGVKFTPFSETITFVFTNVDQTTTVSEVFGV